MNESFYFSISFVLFQREGDMSFFFFVCTGSEEESGV